jgi:serine/threonine-protein kinase
MKRRDIHWVLAPDLQIRPLRGLDPKVVKEILPEGAGRGNESHVVFRESTRSLPLAVNRSVLRVLRRFRRPTSFLAVVLRTAREDRRDPYEALSDLQTLVGRLVEAEILVRPDRSGRARKGGPEFRPGQRFRGYVILECIRSLSDGDVYRVRNPRDQTEHALKILSTRQGSRQARAEAAARLRNECRVLPALEGTAASSLEGKGTHGRREFALIRWISGMSLLHHANRIRGSGLGPVAQRAGLLRLARNCLNALDSIHTRGFLHGDFHPGNILVTAQGQVRLVDFGLATEISAGTRKREKPAGGVIQYLSPEVAARMMSRRDVPPAGVASEIYSAAVVLFELLTGRHYLPWSALKSTTLEQILHRPPLRFADLGAEPWPEMEAVLGKALSKNPLDRFSSVKEFNRALGKASGKTSLHRVPRPHRRIQSALAGFAQSTLEEWRGLAYPTLRKIQGPPYASLANGGAGVAYALWKAATTWSDGDLLAQADHWIGHAVADAGASSALLAPRDGLTRREVRPSSFYTGMTGLHFTQALVSHARGDRPKRDRAISDFAFRCRSSIGGSPELFQGTAGCLLASIHLSRETGEKPLEGLSKELAQHLLQTAFRHSRDGRPWGELRYTGIAHGWGGIYFAILEWAHQSRNQLPGWFFPSLEEFARSGTESRGGMNWPLVARSRPPRFVSRWCNGSGGLLFLWARAYERTRQPLYLEVARSAGTDLVQNPDPHDNLCCGRGGRAYSYLALERVDSAGGWEPLALELAKQTVASKVRSYGLLKGRAGLLCLAVDLLQGREAGGFPCFER